MWLTLCLSHQFFCFELVRDRYSLDEIYPSVSIRCTFPYLFWYSTIDSFSFDPIDMTKVFFVSRLVFCKNVSFSFNMTLFPHLRRVLSCSFIHSVLTSLRFFLTFLYDNINLWNCKEKVLIILNVGFKFQTSSSAVFLVISVSILRYLTVELV